jgi:sterol desaturase/sphingolipid hydroxylase (fatty acid hydroxylase superfamily)
MTAHVVIVDLVALLLIVVGVHLAFRQRLVRRWWRLLRPRPPRAHREDAEDPVHYALIISGIMIAAFGLIIAVFATTAALAG